MLPWYILSKRALTAKGICLLGRFRDVLKNLPSLHTFSSKWFLTQQVSPPKTTMVMENHLNFTVVGDTTFIHGCFSSQSSQGSSGCKSRTPKMAGTNFLLVKQLAKKSDPWQWCCW